MKTIFLPTLFRAALAALSASAAQAAPASDIVAGVPRANVTFYRNHQPDTQYFRDITSGNNGYYSAGSGFDLVTGMCSMRITNLANAL